MTHLVSAAEAAALLERATEGPWVVSSWDPRTVIPARWADEEAEPEQRGDFMCSGASKAPDALLIAAAPDLAHTVQVQAAQIEAAKALHKGEHECVISFGRGPVLASFGGDFEPCPTALVLGVES